MEKVRLENIVSLQGDDYYIMEQELDPEGEGWELRRSPEPGWRYVEPDSKLGCCP